MSAVLTEVLRYGTVPVIAGLVGGLIAAYRPPGAQLRSAVQHFAAGVVLAAAAFELLVPLRKADLFVAVAGFVIGVAVMIAVRAAADAASSRGKMGLLAVSVVDAAIDGVVIGVGFASGGSTGPLLVVALTLEVLFLGIAIAASFEDGTPKWTRIAASTSLGVALMLGSVIGALTLGGASETTKHFVYAFGAVVFIFLVTEELLVEAHEVRERLFSPAYLTAGFIAFLILSRLAD